MMAPCPLNWDFIYDECSEIGEFDADPELSSIDGEVCPDCDGSGEVSGDYFADDGMTTCNRCGGKGRL